MANYQSIHSGSNIDYVISNALLQSTAASIYLTKTDANTLYPLKDGTGASGTWVIDITGNSHTANLLNNIGGRIDSPSAMTADGRMRMFLSTGSMTTDKPPSGDGHILHFGWDNTGGWDNEIAIGNANAGGFMAFRCGSGSGDATTNTQSWSGWRTILDNNNYHNYTRSSEELTNIAFTWSGSYSTGSWMLIWNNETGSKGGQLFRAINQTNTAAWVRGGASGNWNIMSVGCQSRRTISGSDHAVALKNNFNSYKSNEPRNCLLSYYSSASGNGSLCMGYYLSGYDSSPYGGFFVAHYTNAWYVGISNGSYTQYALTKSASSSAFTKENIAPMTNEEASKILNLNLISFDYKPEYENGAKGQFGLMAEECKEIIPWAVVSPPYNPKEGEEKPVETIEYWKFIPYLLKMVQIQQDEINELKKEIQQLKEMIRNG